MIISVSEKGKTGKEWEVDSCLYQFVILQLFRVDAVWVVNGSINFTDAHALGPKPVQVPHGVQTHITKALWGKKKHIRR